MRILLTGGTGFVGNYLKLNLKHDVIGPSSSQLNLLDSTAVRNFLDSNKFDAVVHCAVSGRNRVYDKDPEIAENNLRMFYNLAMNREYYGKFINFGSGAEFGLEEDVEFAYENSIEYVVPEESYGFSKNLITRCIHKIPNFFNLRLFACLDPSEGPTRLVTKFKNTANKGEKFTIDQDRYIDFFTLTDVCTVVEEVLKGNISDQDLNLVYQEKLMTSDLLTKYCEIHEIDKSLVVVTGYGKNYTGDGTRLANSGILLEGLDATLKRYKD